MTVSLICQAIQQRALLAFDYGGLHRIVAPYCHGTSAAGQPLLRAVQLRGGSRSQGLGFGKLWRIDRIERAVLLRESFAPDDPDYNPADRAMATIHCHV